MAYEYLLHLLCVVIATVSAHTAVNLTTQTDNRSSLEVTGPFITRESSSMFIRPTHSLTQLWTFDERSCRREVGNIYPAQYCQRLNTPALSLETPTIFRKPSVVADVDIKSDEESSTQKYTYKKKVRENMRHARLRPTGLMWHKSARVAPPPPPACNSSPCRNSAACTNTGSSFLCSCTGGWTGTICDTDINECNSNPCQNGAVCNNGQNRYTCQCSPGWTGVNCQTDIDECVSNPCQNGGTCNNRQNHYTCTCLEDFIGTNCENDTCESAQQTGADFVFVVDSSASQTQALFEKQKDYMKTFISNFPIGPNDFQVAVVSYAFSTTIHCHLNTYSTETDLHSAIDQMVYVSGTSYTGSALRTVRENLLTTANGMRSSLNRYIIALTDGMSSDITDTQSQADQLKLGGATLMAVAFGPQIYHPELLDIASDSRKVFPSSMQDPVFTILRSHLPVCPDCFRNTSDVGILFDASTNLSPAQFYPAIDALITLIEELPIGPSNVHISYMKYAQDVYDEFNFNQYQTTGEVVKVIVASLKQYTGPGNLTKALDQMTYNGFHDSRGARSDARKFAIVFTQGNFDDFDSVKTSADTLKSSGVTLALVGIGTESNTNLTSLLGLASDPAFAFVVGEEFNISDQVLRSMASSVEFDVCEFD